MSSRRIRRRRGQGESLELTGHRNSMINALALEEGEYSDDESTRGDGERRPPERYVSSDDGGKGEPAQTFIVEEDTSSTPSTPSTPPAISSPALCPMDPSARPSTASRDDLLSDDDDDHDAEPPSFLSLPVASLPEELSEDDEGHLASSIYAIHRPIAARRRAVTGEAGEGVKDGAYAVQTESDLAVKEHFAERGVGELSAPKRERSTTVVSRSSAKSTNRREKLADKLEDIFGLDGAEKVVAGEPCASLSRR